MHRRVSLILAAIVVGATASAAFAQADAQAAYQQAKAAFDAGKYTDARDLAKKAAETDTKNPEVFLLLGKSHFQLGELDDAVAAWKRTLALAPNEPFAAKMLEALQGQRADADTRIKLLAALVQEKLYKVADAECSRLLADKALSPAQRARIMTLQAEVLLQTGQLEPAQKVLSELTALFPTHADPVQTALLSGQVKLRSPGDGPSEGVALLKKLVAEHPDTAASATARFELAAFELRAAVEPARVDTLAKWLVDNPKHPKADDARVILIDAYRTLSLRGPRPAPGAGLSPFDVQGLAVTAGYIQGKATEDYARNACEQWIKHFDARYAGNRAYSAAVAGTEKLLAIALSRSARLPVLKAAGLYKYRLALDWLDQQARAGQLPAAVKDGGLPKPLADVVATNQTIRTEFPSEQLWVEEAAFATDVRGFAARVPWPDEVNALRGPDAWAVAIILPVIKADGDPAAVQKGIELLQGLINDYGQRTEASARQLTIQISRMLVTSPLAPTHPSWPGVLAKHAELLDAYARFVMEENVKAGKDDENEKVSPQQRDLLAAIEQHLARDAQYGPAALNLVRQHVEAWAARGHWAVADEMVAALAKVLPADQRRAADLAEVELWVREVQQEHQRLVKAGLSVPRQLDPRLQKALLRCYELQAGLDPSSPKLQQVRQVWDGIVGHYKALEYFDVAESALKVKPEKAVEAADEYAAFQLVVLQDEAARRELAQLLKQYGATEKIAITPGFKAVLAAWTKLITDRPASPLVPQAVERIFGIGQLFEQYGAPEVAAGVYADLAKFAAGVKVLAQATPGAPSVAQRAAFARAAALDAQARKVLAKALADRKTGDPPPAKLSDEFTAAIAAYQAFVESNPESSLVDDAIAKIMQVAMEYAKVDAWDVAGGIYADLLQSKLKIRRPERLQFARAVCHLGHAMSDHAREVLNVLTSTGLRGASEPGGGPPMLAMGGGTRAPMDTAAKPDRGRGGGRMEAGGIAAAAATPAPPVSAAPGLQPPGEVHGLGASSSADGSIALDKMMEKPSAEAQRDTQLLAMITQQEAKRSAQVAQLREQRAVNFVAQQPAQQGEQKPAPAPGPVLSEAELARQDKALAAAYDLFQDIRKNYAETPTAEQARGEILVMVGHWRGLSEWQRSAALAERYLADNPTDRELPRLRLETARDRLAWAGKPIATKMTKQDLVAEVSKRFSAARVELGKVVADFPKERAAQEEAQWDLATSFVTEARVISAVAPTLARGQFVRATHELRRIPEKYPNHPRIGTIPQMLWDISQELAGRGYDEEAILVWNELTTFDPINPLAQQAAVRIAETYQQKLKRPLKAAEAYQELNFLRGGNDQGVQNAIFQIGTELKNEKRWVEALHVLEAFVDSYPQHPQAGQALTMVGQIHQANEAWKDAIAAYRRVIAEFKDGQWVKDAKWAIAECTINLSQWQEATTAFRDYVAAYPQDPKVAEANRRIEVLKDLARYQSLVDEKGQRKSFDAQYQIAMIVRQQLANPVKAIIEFRKVATNFADSHLADDALYEVGTTYLSLGETQKARQALYQVAEKYPSSPLADDSLYMVGKSFEDEADKLAALTREKTLEQAKDVAQRGAYEQAQSNRRMNLERQQQRVADLKSSGKAKSAEEAEAYQAANFGAFNDTNVVLFAQQASKEVETLSATQLADREDKINGALRKAIEAYTSASKVAGGDKAGDALLQMANIFDKRLKDSKAAMQTWLEIVRQFSGTSVAEDASWKIAQYYEREGKHAEAIEAYNAFLRNYRRSPNAGPAQFAIAEGYEHLGQWVQAMDSYTKYITNFAEGPLVGKAKEQINWIKTYRL